MRYKTLKSGEKIVKILNLFGVEKVLWVQIWAHDKEFCKNSCFDEYGCSRLFFKEDIEGGTVEQVFKNPKHYKIEYDNEDNPVRIVPAQ